MRKRSLGIDRALLLAALCAALGASDADGQPATSQPTSMPTTRAAAADVYLDRVAAELGAWNGGLADDHSEFPNIHFIAARLVNARGNANDRVQARRLLDITVTRRADASDEIHHLEQLGATIDLRLALDDADVGTRPLIDEYARVAARETTEANLHAALYYGLIGDRDRCLREARHLTTAPSLASFLHEANRHAMADAVVADHVKQRSPLFQFNAALGTGTLADALAGAGPFQDALDLIGKTRSAASRVQMLVGMGRRLAACGRAEEAKRAFAAALVDWDAAATAGERVHVSIERLIDEGHFDLAREAFRRTLDAQRRTPDEEDWYIIGEAAALLEDAQAVDVALHALHRSATEGDNQFARQEAAVQEAALLMLVSRAAEADAAFKRAVDLGDGEPLTSFGAYHAFMSATMRRTTVEAGVNAAIAALAPDDLDDAYETAARYELLADHPDAAWRYVGQIDRHPYKRLRERVAILIALQRADRQAEALALLDADPSPLARAQLALYVARDLLGTRLLGSGRMTFDD